MQTENKDSSPDNTTAPSKIVIVNDDVARTPVTEKFAELSEQIDKAKAIDVPSNGITGTKAEPKPLDNLMKRLRRMRVVTRSRKTRGASGNGRKHNGVRGWKRRTASSS